MSLVTILSWVDVSDNKVLPSNQSSEVLLVQLMHCTLGALYAMAGRAGVGKTE